MSTGESKKDRQHDWDRFPSMKQRGEWVEHTGRRLVPDPPILAAGQAKTHHGHAVPRSPTEKEACYRYESYPS
jgi:hypothetical protein